MVALDRYSKLRSIPDYVEDVGKSAYLNPQHPYLGQVRAANREYAADLRALFDERDSLARERDAALESLRALNAAVDDFWNADPKDREPQIKALCFAQMQSLSLLGEAPTSAQDAA